MGHGGTLDPLATGVLVLGIGKGTKVMGEYLKGPKSYAACFAVGHETDTLDSEGVVTERSDAPLVLDEAKLDAFRGEIMQVPPMYSAIRKGGKRLYELAREGKGYDDVDVPPRPCTVHELTVKGTGEDGVFRMECIVGGGTYIRSLIRDLARSHGTLATMTQLERTEAGGFKIEECVDLKSDAEGIYGAAERVSRERGIEF